MTSIINFTPISGAQDESPPCYLLQIDEFRFLLDCGCDENFTIEYIDQLKSLIPSIDAVLLSYPDIRHLGALPYLVGKCGLSCDVYATTPVYQMGQMFAYDLYLSKHNYEDFELFTLDDIDLAFAKVEQVKFNQTIFLKGKGQGLTITPLPAGHMLGGTIWRIVKDGGEDIVYATDYNHKKESHLNSCIIDKISRPSLLITDCINVDYMPERRKKRDELLLSSILNTLRSNGNVLVSVDTAGRVLELSHMLEQMWRTEQGLQAYSLVLLNNISYNVIKFAQSMVEWMSDKMMRAFEGQRNNPFSFRYLTLCHNMQELARVPQPYVILASQPDMECGFSREIFFKFYSSPKNRIIFTQRPTLRTLAHSLIDLNNADSKVISVDRKMRVELTGQELEDYLEAKREEALEKGLIDNSENSNKSIKNEDEESDDSDEDFFNDNDMDEDVEMKSSPTKKNELSASNTIKHDLMMSSRHEGHQKGGGFFKNARKLYPMYPCVEKKLKWDEYGEIINPEEYAIFDVSRMAMAEDKENMDEKMNGDPNSANEPNALESLDKTPTKCVSSLEEITVECQIELIEFEGRSDGESLKKIISMIKPRRLILIRGTEEKIKSFATFCINAEFVPFDKLFTPKTLELVDATTERHIYQVKLRDALVSSLNFSKAKDGVQLAWVEAEISMTNVESLLPQLEDKPTENMLLNGKDKSMERTGDGAIGQLGGRELMPTLQQLPLSRLPPHTTIFVNELKLSDFKQTLMKQGIQAEFSGGVLLCNGQVEVKRAESGHIHLEGTVCEDYFKVRHLLYEQYAIL